MVVLQGANGLSFSPGYTSLAECTQQYKGPNVACFDYDPDGTSWTAFFKLPDGAFRVVRKIPSEGECQRYIAAFKSDIPTACRQLPMPNTCSAACRLPETPPPAKPEAPKPDSNRQEPSAKRRSAPGCTVARERQRPISGRSLRAGVCLDSGGAAQGNGNRPRQAEACCAADPATASV